MPILAGFFLWHWHALAPVWGVLIEAAVAFPIAVGGIAWAWRRWRAHGAPTSVRGAIAFAATFAGGLVTAQAVGLARGRASTPAAFADIAVELAFAVLAMVPAIALGWRVAGGVRGAAAFAVAALPLDLHLGGTVMHLGGSGIALALFAILLPTYLAAGPVLRAVERGLAMRLRPSPASLPSRQPARRTPSP